MTEPVKNRLLTPSEATAQIIDIYRKHYDTLTVREVPRTDIVSRLLSLVGVHRMKLVADGTFGNGVVSFTDMALDGYD